MPQTNQSIFSNYLQVTPTIPRWVWQIIRIFVLAGFIGLIISLWQFPLQSLLIFWGLLVPSLPLIFWLLPGFWRNICPLASSNQLPRLFNFSLAKEVPVKVKRYASVVGLVLLFSAIPLRKILLNDDPIALAIALIGLVSFAFIGGLIFKGKSGWCGSFCPLLPVQRLYGQTPLATVNNSHCKPCVGCTKNCFDFNPQVAYLADLYDEDPIMAGDRKFFAGMMPGLIFAYFTLPYSNESAIYQVYLQFGLYCLIGVGAYQVFETIFKWSAAKNTAIFAIISINLFYWFSASVLIETLNSFFNLPAPSILVWAIRSLVFSYSMYWLWATISKEKLFLARTFESSKQTRVANITHLKNHAEKQSDNPIICILPGGEQLVAKPDLSLLDLLESNGHKINSGCRMGACGADPIAIVEGEENLAEKSAEEQSTLERLGYSQGVRMACCVKATANIKINLDPSTAIQSDETLDFAQDDSIHSIIIVGNGIAGVTAADFIRRHHKKCKIHLVGAEKYPLYNRMAISKLIYGRTALQSLILMPDEWYSKRDIQQWLNSRVESIDAIKRVVTIATGETINYDKLIITTGSNAHIPQLENWGIKGCFVLRTAEDGMAIRTFVQDHHCKRICIAGGGLLGLEAAYAFIQLGLRVTVLERSPHLLKRQLDEKSASILHAYLAALGITIVYQSEVASVIGKDIIDAVELKTGEKILTNLLLVAAGIVANQKLTSDKFLKASKGILVNDYLQTSMANIFAAGDIAELQNNPGRVTGLWPVAVEQGRIAAINALGGNQQYVEKPIATGLKVVGVELTSIGEFNGRFEDLEICFKNQDSYRKLVVRERKIIGGILLGHPKYASALTRLINQQTELSVEEIIQLEKDDWQLLH